jgi:peroxiredoxin
METNSEIYPSSWVEQRLATLDAGVEWQPDATRALARLREEMANGSSRMKRHVWIAMAAVSAAALTLLLTAGPTPRALAERCVSCSVALWQHLSASSGPSATQAPLLKDRKPASDFVRDDTAGKSMRLSGLKGKVVLLNFWATWCGGCQVEIPWLIDFQNQYQDRGLAVVGVSMDADGWKSVRPYLKEKNVNYSTVIGNEELAKRYGVEAMPVTLLIDREGKIAALHVGLVSKSDYQAEIETLLRENSSASTNR